MEVGLIATIPCGSTQLDVLWVCDVCSVDVAHRADGVDTQAGTLTQLL